MRQDSFLNPSHKSGEVAYICYPSTQEREAGGLWQCGGHLVYIVGSQWAINTLQGPIPKQKQ